VHGPLIEGRGKGNAITGGYMIKVVCNDSPGRDEHQSICWNFVGVTLDSYGERMETAYNGEEIDSRAGLLL